MWWNYLIPLIVGVLILSGCAPAPPVAGETGQTVKVEAQGVVLRCEGETFWSEDEWSRMLENKDEFRTDLIGKFTSDLSRHGERGERAVNAKLEFNEDGKSTILRCDIHGAISKRGNSYRATFFWLLGPLGLDFIDNDFEESEKGLFWEGFVNDVPTTVIIELPTIDSFVYKAWSRSIVHCHAHVWWELSP